MPYFGISILFLERLAFSESTSLTAFLIGDAVNFTASVTGGLSFLSSLLLLKMYYTHTLKKSLNFLKILVREHGKLTLLFLLKVKITCGCLTSIEVWLLLL